MKIVTKLMLTTQCIIFIFCLQNVSAMETVEEGSSIKKEITREIIKNHLRLQTADNTITVLPKLYPEAPSNGPYLFESGSEITNGRRCEGDCDSDSARQIACIHSYALICLPYRSTRK